jgi:hypothetical protein
MIVDNHLTLQYNPEDSSEHEVIYSYKYVAETIIIIIIIILHSIIFYNRRVALKIFRFILNNNL